MTSRLIGALAIASVVANACADGIIIGPDPKETVTLDFCADNVPIWFAIQNESENWQEVSVSSAGTVTFDATLKVSVAYVTQPSTTDFITQIWNVTRDELDDNSGQVCAEHYGTRTLSGTVTGLTGQQVSRLSMEWSTAGTTTSNATYSFANLPEGPLDLVAVRHATSTTQPPDRVIVRRDVNLPSGSTIPSIDFGSLEAVPFAVNIVTLANRGTDLISVTTDLLTSNGTSARLMQFMSADANASTFISLPQTLRVATDMHVLSVHASASNGTREVTNYYRTPRDEPLAFGPQLSTPTFTATAAPPYVRPRVTVPSQPEYPSAMEATFSQLASGGFRIIRMLVSAEFLRESQTTWELLMPDLAGAGYESAWALQQPTSSVDAIAANARGFDTIVEFLLGAAPSGIAKSAQRFANSVLVQ